MNIKFIWNNTNPHQRVKSAKTKIKNNVGAINTINTINKEKSDPENEDKKEEKNKNNKIKSRINDFYLREIYRFF